MEMVTFGEFLANGASFSSLIYAMSHTVIPIIFGLWCAKWIYQILIDLGNGGDR